MQTCCSSCGERTDNIGSKRVTMTNKVVRDKSRCAICWSNKPRFLKQNLIKKGLQNINPKLFIY